MKRLIVVFCLLKALLVLPAAAEVVCAVHDGDTLRLCNGERVRLADIDAPELKQPKGPEARDFLQRLVFQRDVALTCQKTRSYNRRVCQVSVQGVPVQEAMVLNGWAHDAPRYSQGRFQAAEAWARSQRLGVWADPVVIKPWDWRHAK